MNHLYAMYRNSKPDTSRLREFMDGLNGAELHEAQELLLRPEHERQALERQSEAISIFIAGHEEYLDCDENSDTMKKVLYGILRERNRKYATHQDLKDAYNEMLSRGWAKLNAKVVNEKKAADIQKRAIEHRDAVTFNPDRAETMPMAELRMTADAQLRGIR